MDVALELEIIVYSLNNTMVSILVLVDVALEPHYLYHDKQDIRVSILVLVDVALEPIFALSVIHSLRCFNPCSRGCRS